MIVVVVSSLILHTVNNGKAWSMTVLYAYIQFGIAGSFLKALAPIFTVRTLNLLSVAVVLSPHEPHTMIPRILEEQHDDCGCFFDHSCYFCTSYQSHKK